MFKKRKFLIGGALVAVAIGYLGFMGFKGSASYYYTVSQFAALAETPYEQNLRLNGAVSEGTIARDGLDLQFDITEGETSLPVVYSGAVPDTFTDGADVVVEGQVTPDGVFHAKSILMKCPSKYEAE